MVIWYKVREHNGCSLFFVNGSVYDNVNAYERVSRGDNLNKEKRQKKSPIVIVAICIGVFFGAFQMYMFHEEKSYIYATDFIETTTVIEVSMEEEEGTYYVSHQQDIFDQLLQGLDSATFKPTNQTPKNPQYTIRMYNESLQVETTVSVFSNEQMEINDEFYNVDEGNIKLFEEAMFTKENEVILHTYNEFSAIISNKLFHVGWVSEEDHDWAEVIALVRIAKDKKVDLTSMNLLHIAPTREVAERLIAYEMIEPYDYTTLMEAVQLERLGVAKVLLEHGIGISPDNTLIGNPSPMVVAKLNEDREMVDLLLSYGFEDEYVDPKHIERAQNVIQFKGEDSEEVKAGLKRENCQELIFKYQPLRKRLLKLGENIR